jgi:hypothetical protein
MLLNVHRLHCLYKQSKLEKRLFVVRCARLEFEFTGMIAWAEYCLGT